MGSLERIYSCSFHSLVPYGIPKTPAMRVAAGQKLTGMRMTRRMSTVLLRLFVSHRDTGLHIAPQIHLIWPLILAVFLLIGVVKEPLKAMRLA